MGSYREEGAKKTKVMWEKEEKEKHTALLVGVLFFMLLVFFLWFLNTKNLFEYFKLNKKKDFNIDQFSEEFNQSFVDVKTKISDMKFEAVPSDFSPQIPREK